MACPGATLLWHRSMRTPVTSTPVPFADDAGARRLSDGTEGRLVCPVGAASSASPATAPRQPGALRPAELTVWRACCWGCRRCCAAAIAACPARAWQPWGSASTICWPADVGRARRSDRRAWPAGARQPCAGTSRCHEIATRGVDRCPSFGLGRVLCAGKRARRGRSAAAPAARRAADPRCEDRRCALVWPLVMASPRGDEAMLGRIGCEGVLARHRAALAFADDRLGHRRRRRSPAFVWRVENAFRFFLDPADTEVHRATWPSLSDAERTPSRAGGGAPARRAPSGRMERHHVRQDLLGCRATTRYSLSRARRLSRLPRAIPSWRSMEGLEDAQIVDCSWLTSPQGAAAARKAVTLPCDTPVQLDVPYPGGAWISVEIGGSQVAETAAASPTFSSSAWATASPPARAIPTCRCASRPIAPPTTASAPALR